MFMAASDCLSALEHRDCSRSQLRWRVRFILLCPIVPLEGQAELKLKCLSQRSFTHSLTQLPAQTMTEPKRNDVHA